MAVTKKQIFSNIIWRFLERIGAQLVAFIVSIVLARILMPEDYGLIALVSIFITILQVFVDSGLGNALIQKKDADDCDYSTVFFTNIFFCLILYLIVFLTAPLIANFYKNDLICNIIRVLGLTIVISGVKNIQQAYVAKNMMFKKFFFATLFGTIVAAILGISMAMLGYGVWALVAQQLSNLFIDTLILWLTVKWRPKLLFSFARLKSLFSYGWKLLLSCLISTVYTKMRQLIIGKKYTPEDLAFFNRGESLPNLIVQNVDSSISSVLLPSMSSVQDDSNALKNMVCRAIKSSTYVISPLLLGMAAVAPNLIKILLTDKWLFAVPYMRIFCCSFLFFPLFTANLNAINANGRSDLFLKIEIIKKSVGFSLLLIAMWFGVKALAFSVLLESIIEVFIDSYPNKKLIGYGIVAQLLDVLPNYIISIIMAGVVMFIGLLNLPSTVVFVVQVLIGIIVYILLSIITKNASFIYFYTLIMKSRYKRKEEKNNG